MLRNPLVFTCMAAAALVLFCSCKTWPSITMTCQFDFFNQKGACSFINESTMEGKGCVKVEVLHVTKNQVIDSVVLCADHVPPMESVTKTLSFNQSTLKACKTHVVKKGQEKIEKCLLQLSDVEM